MKKLLLNMESIADDLSIVSDDLFGVYEETKKKKYIKEKYHDKLKEQISIIESAVAKLQDLKFEMENIATEEE